MFKVKDSKSNSLPPDDIMSTLNALNDEANAILADAIEN